MNESLPTIVILGASGLIGASVAVQLMKDDYAVVPVARRFGSDQKAILGPAAIESSIVELTSVELADLLTEARAVIVVNCVGVLQDGSRGKTDEVHHGFVARLVEAMARLPHAALLLHVSIPGEVEEDQTMFSVSKRAAEREIRGGPVPYIILRPGFIVADAAYGGSALIRALAALPVELASGDARRPFAVTDVTDVVRTVEFVAKRWSDGDRHWNAVWDVMERNPQTIGDVLDGFRQRLGGPTKRWPLPAWLMCLGAKAGDFLAYLGWGPPIRSTAIFEMRRGVEGNPERWIEATGIEPTSLDQALQKRPITVQEKWFSCLYLLKPLVIGILAVFWLASGLIALTVAYDAATAILTAHGLPLQIAQMITIVSSLADICIGVAIAFKKTCRFGLLIGIGVSFFYMVGAAVMTPDLWVEPLGALVKTGPAIVLMLVALAIFDDR